MHRLLVFVAIALLASSCASSPGDPRGDAASREGTLIIGAIPDQDPQELQRTYGEVSEYLSDRLGVPVRYVPVTDYTASVTAFRQGGLQLVFFGGLTGVQARAQVPGALPIAQRDIDASFRSVFVAGTDTGIDQIDDVSGLRALAGHSFTFGSETSTSGRLMPQHFLSEAGVEPGQFSGNVGYSGSHDATAKLVEAGSYQVGTLNAAVWDERVRAGEIDTDKVREVFRTPPYHDYHWLARPDLDERFGTGFTQRVTETLLGMDGDEAGRQILDLFQANRFIPTEAANYTQIESVARALGLLN